MGSLIPKTEHLVFHLSGCKVTFPLTFPNGLTQHDALGDLRKQGERSERGVRVRKRELWVRGPKNGAP